eukprot:13809832-Alexandrium_andersonii.AAC.1
MWERLRPRQARNANRPCPALGIGGSRRLIHLWAPGARREVRRPWRAASKSWGRRLPPIPSGGQG